MSEMLALVYRDGQVGVRRLPRPAPRDGEVLLRVEAAAICATDLKIWQKGHRNIPAGTDAVLGHEVVGRAVAIGDGVDPALEGRRVAVAPNVGCGCCPVCQAGRDSYCPRYRAFGVGLDGGLAEFMRVTAPAVARGNLVDVPEGIPARVAVLAEAAACCYRGLQACSLRAGETVLVMGAGPMGILAVIMARAMGAARVLVAEPQEGRRRRALALGADRVFDPNAGEFPGQLRDCTGGWGADVVMVAAPAAQAQRQGIEAAASGGRVNLFAGLAPGERFDDFPSGLVHYRGLHVLGTTGTTSVEMRAVVSMMSGELADGLKEVVTAVYPLSEAATALEEARQGKGLKVMVVPE